MDGNFTRFLLGSVTGTVTGMISVFSLKNTRLVIEKRGDLNEE